MAKAKKTPAKKAPAKKVVADAETELHPGDTANLNYIKSQYPDFDASGLDSEAISEAAVKVKQGVAL